MVNPLFLLGRKFTGKVGDIFEGKVFGGPIGVFAPQQNT